MLVRESIARDILRLVIWYPFRWLIRLLPIAWGLALFRMLGRIHYVVFRQKEHLLAKNLKSAFGERMSADEVKDVIIKYYENHYVDRLQIFLFPRLKRDNIDRYHIFHGLENLEYALAKKRGCILLHAHVGPAQLPLCALGVKGYPVIQIGLPSDEGTSWIGRHVAFRLRQRYEAQIKASIVSARSFLRPAFEHLENNGIIMITGDGAGGIQPIGKYAIFAFLGRQLPFSLGGVRLAQKTGAPILPLFTVVGENGRYKTVIEDPIEMGQSSTRNERAFVGRMAVFVRRLEEYVSEFPYLWHFWDEFHTRCSMGSTFSGQKS